MNTNFFATHIKILSPPSNTRKPCMTEEDFYAIFLVLTCMTGMLWIASNMQEDPTTVLSWTPYRASVRRWLSRCKTGETVTDRDVECVICMDGTSDLALECGHAFHRRCVEEWLCGDYLRGCPVCRELPAEVILGGAVNARVTSNRFSWWGNMDHPSALV